MKFRFLPRTPTDEGSSLTALLGLPLARLFIALKIFSTAIDQLHTLQLIGRRNAFENCDQFRKISHEVRIFIQWTFLLAVLEIGEVVLRAPAHVAWCTVAILQKALPPKGNDTPGKPVLLTER